MLVSDFEEEGDQSSFPTFTRGFARSLLIALTRFTGLRVFGADSALGQPGGLAAERQPRLDVDYFVTGQTALHPGRFRIDVLLVRSGDRPRCLGGDVRAPAWSRRDHRRAQRRRQSRRPRSGATLRRDPERPDPRRRRRSARVPRQLCRRAVLLRLLADIRPRDHRSGPRRPRARRRRRARVRRGARLPVARLHQRLPLRPSGRRGAAPVRWTAPSRWRSAPSNWRRARPGRATRSASPDGFSGDHEGGLEELEAARALNPNDTPILADLGQRYAMLARWDEAVPLLEESYATNPAQPGGYRIGLFLYHFAHRRFAEALSEARRVDAAQVVYGHVAVAAAAAELGLADEAAAAVATVLSLDPDYPNGITADLEGRGVAPFLVRALVASLAKAGLTAAPPHIRRSDAEP